MLKSIALSSAVALVCLAAPQSASAQHDIRAFLSSDGLDFLATEAPSFVPSVIEPLPFTSDVGCITFEQSDTVLNFNITSLDISLPRNGIIRVDMSYTGSVTGELYADDIFLCAGELTCQDDLQIRAGTAVIEYEVSILDGAARVTPSEISFSLAPEDVDLVFSECGASGDSLNSMIDFAKDWILIAVEATLADIASENLGPMLEEMLDGFSFDGTVGIASYRAELQDLDADPSGINFRIDGDMIDDFAAAPCVRDYDVNGGPEDLVGVTPLINGPNAQHLGLAINMGMINKAFYTVWRRGLLCLSDAHLQAIGLELDLNTISALLPGFPAGTTMGFDLNLSEYPLLRPEESTGSTLTLDLNGILLDLHGDRPDGTRNTLHVEIDMEATATLAIDPGTNAIIAKLDGAKITRMALRDEREATGAGFDVARILILVEDHILPDILDELGTIPLTGPTFTFSNYAILLRNLLTNNAFISMGLDLFRIPDNDSGVPETEITESPDAITNPGEAIVKVLGTDAEIPSELLQYQVTIDGVAQELSFVRVFSVGEAGVSAKYHVTVAAVDLSGNIDPTPAEVDVDVDGIAPIVAVVGKRTLPANEGPVELRWVMSDDQSSSDAMQVRVEVYDVVDPSDSLSAVRIDTQDLAAGATSTTVEVTGSSRVYRIEIHAVDEAGNDSVASMLLTNPDPGGCGCTSGGSSEGSLGFWLLALGFLALRRKRGQLN